MSRFGHLTRRAAANGIADFQPHYILDGWHNISRILSCTDAWYLRFTHDLTDVDNSFRFLDVDLGYGVATIGVAMRRDTSLGASANLFISTMGAYYKNK